MNALEKIRQSKSSEWWRPMRPLKLLTYMLDQRLSSVSNATNQVTNLVIVHLGRRYTWLRGEKRKRTKFIVSQMEMKRIIRMMMGGRLCDEESDVDAQARGEHPTLSLVPD